MKRILWFVISIMCATLITVSCNNNKPKEDIQFYYYPKTNVYYSVANNSYVYSLDSGKTWLSMNSSTDKEPVTLGERIVITSKTDSVWKQNEEHRKLYAGTLYSIIDDSNKMVPAASPVTERKTVQLKRKIKAKKEESIEPARKRGVKKFFDKIFGKRNK